MADIDEWGQPTIEAVQRAWTHAIECADIPGSKHATLAELQRLATAKTTLVGGYEIRTMFAVHDYLRAHGHGVTPTSKASDGGSNS